MVHYRLKHIDLSTRMALGVHLFLGATPFRVLVARTTWW